VAEEGVEDPAHRLGDPPVELALDLEVTEGGDLIREIGAPFHHSEHVTTS
jgi:hypothetical protein